MQKYYNNVVDNGGNAVRGASVAVYDASGALATLYSDDGVTRQLNPLTTDSDGTFSFYAASGVYSITVSGPLIGSKTITGVMLQDALSEDVVWADRFAVVPGTGADQSAAIARAVAEIQGSGRTLRFRPGDYVITQPITPTQKIILDFCGRTATLVLATQNMSGIVLGDGTDATRSALFGSEIRAPAFRPAAGVAAFTDGACIEQNYVAHVDIIKPSFYGLDGATRKLFHGLRQRRAVECDVPYILAQEMKGQAVYAYGDSTADRTADCNYDFARVFNCDSDAFYWGQNTAGLAAYRATMYGVAGWLVHINATPGSGGQNYFVTDIDGEIMAGASGGVYVQSGQRALISGGWLGAAGGSGAPLAVWIGAGADSCEVDVDVAPGRIVIDGPANTVSGGGVSGDSVTAGTGLTIGGDDTVVADGVRVRQWTGTGIGFSGTPQRVQIGSVQYKNNGTDITAPSGWSALAGPSIKVGRTDQATSYTAAATLNIPPSVRFVQVTGATVITTIASHGVGARLTVQAGAGGISFNTGGNLGLSAAPLAVAAFKTVSFVCDGVSWFEDGRDF